MSGFLALRSHYDDWEETLRTATEVARKHGTDGLTLQLLDAMCVVNRQLARNSTVIELAMEQLQLARRLDDNDAVIAALGNAGWAARKLGQLGQATSWLEQAVSSCTPETPNRLASRVHNGLAMLHREVERIDRALPLIEAALRLERVEGDPRIVSICLENYAGTLLDAGRVDEAQRATLEALELSTGIGDEQSIASIEQLIGQINSRRGRWTVASNLFERSRRTAERIGETSRIAEILLESADSAWRQGVPREALAPLRTAAAIWGELDMPIQRARALARLELACVAVEQVDRAAEHRRQWEAILRELDLPPECLRLSVSGWRLP
jgi:tetratricopeptide (TPR) repeat protein